MGCGLGKFLHVIPPRSPCGFNDGAVCRKKGEMISELYESQPQPLFRRPLFKGPFLKGKKGGGGKIVFNFSFLEI